MDKEIKKDIETIKQFIDKSRHVVKEKGIYYILWGCVVILGTLVSYLLGLLKLQHLIGWTWILLDTITFSYILIREKGKKRKEPKITFGEILQVGLWIGFMLTSLSLIIFSILTWGMDLKVILAVICFMLVDWRYWYVFNSESSGTTGTTGYVCLCFTFSNPAGNIFYEEKKLDG